MDVDSYLLTAVLIGKSFDLYFWNAGVYLSLIHISLQTIRADIDYGTAEAHTTYGRIGVKVWIYRGAVSYTHLLTEQFRSITLKQVSGQR